LVVLVEQVYLLQLMPLLYKELVEVVVQDKLELKVVSTLVVLAVVVQEHVDLRVGVVHQEQQEQQTLVVEVERLIVILQTMLDLVVLDLLLLDTNLNN
jgi:hypothetical protein